MKNKDQIEVIEQSYMESSDTTLRAYVSKLLTIAKQLQAESDLAYPALREVIKTTYGTEWISHDLEEYESNYEIMERHYSSKLDTARTAVWAIDKLRNNPNE